MTISEGPTHKIRGWMIENQSYSNTLVSNSKLSKINLEKAEYSYISNLPICWQ